MNKHKQTGPPFELMTAFYCGCFAGAVEQLKAHCMSTSFSLTFTDTIVSGAVEQLKTHCNRLKVPLYERGYEKDPAKVCCHAQCMFATLLCVLCVKVWPKRTVANKCSLHISQLSMHLTSFSYNNLPLTWCVL